MQSIPRTLQFQPNSTVQAAQYAKLQLPDRGHHWPLVCQTRIAVHAAITTKAAATHPFIYTTHTVLLF